MQEEHVRSTAASKVSLRAKRGLVPTVSRQVLTIWIAGTLTIATAAVTPSPAKAADSVTTCFLDEFMWSDSLCDTHAPSGMESCGRCWYYDLNSPPGYYFELGGILGAECPGQGTENCRYVEDETEFNDCWGYDPTEWCEAFAECETELEECGVGLP